MEVYIVVLNGKDFNKLISSKKKNVYLAYEDDQGLLANSDPFIKHCLKNITTNARVKINEPIWIRTGPRLISDMYNQTKDFYPISWHKTMIAVCYSSTDIQQTD